MGHLAALKSTVAQRLSVDLGIICLNKDTMKEVLADTIGFADRSQNLLLSKAVFSMFRYLSERILFADDALILESNFKPDEIAKLLEDSRLRNTAIYAVFMTGDKDVLYARYVAREPYRHKAHTSTGTMPYEMFVASMQPFDPTPFNSHFQIIDTTNPDDFGYSNLVAVLKSWLLAS